MTLRQCTDEHASVDDVLISYDAQCPHGTYYDDCQICSGAQADFERWCFELTDD